MKKINIVIAVLMVCVAGFFVWISVTQSDETGNKKNAGNKSIDAYVLKASRLADEISVSGSLLAFDEVELRNEVAGRVVMVNLPEGSFVKKGSLLVKMFDDDLQATLKKLQAQLAIQEEFHKRQEELFKIGGITQNEYEQILLELNTLRADIEIQKTMIRKTEVLAPFDGHIGLRNISIGASIPVSTLLATIRTDDHLKLDFYVPEKYSADIKPNMRVKFNLFNDNKPFIATVMATEQGIDYATRNLKVRAEVQSRDKTLIPGAFANVKLNLSENSQALLIPTQAIIPKGEQKSVIVARDGKAHFTEVKTGVRKASNIEIIEGLNVGDTVVTSGILFLKEGDVLQYADVR